MKQSLTGTPKKSAPCQTRRLRQREQNLDNPGIRQAAANELFARNELVAVLVQLVHNSLYVIAVQLVRDIRLGQVVDGANDLVELLLVYQAVVVDVVELEGDVELLVRVARDRQGDREHEIAELYLAAVVGVECLEDGLAVLFGAAVRKEEVVELGELVLVHSAGWAVLLLKFGMSLGV
jgi:hypothetical protein